MKTQTPLLYAPHLSLPQEGAIRKIKLLPVRTLIRHSIDRITTQLKIQADLTVYTSVL